MKILRSSVDKSLDSTHSPNAYAILDSLHKNPGVEQTLGRSFLNPVMHDISLILRGIRWIDQGKLFQVYKSEPVKKRSK